MDRSFGRIELGPGSVIYLVVCTLVMFAAVYTQANLLFWALGLVVGALVVSLLLSAVSLRGIEVQRLTPSRGVAGEPLVLRYDLRNRSRLAWFSVEIVETWGGRFGGWRRVGPLVASPPRLKGRPFGWILHIGPGQSIQAEAPCWPLRRGLLRFEKIIVRSGFPFGIIRKTIVFRQPGEALIYPPLRRLSRHAALSLTGMDIHNARHSNRGGGMDEFFGLRPYRPGDSYKLIDWKHSARTSKLVSRELTHPRPQRMMILLDLRQRVTAQSPADQEPSVPNELWLSCQEEAINLTGSLIREAFMHGIHVGLAVAGADCPALPMHNSKTHRQRLLDTLAMLEIDEAKAQPAPTPPTVIVRPATRRPDGRADRPGATIQSVKSHSRHNPDTPWDVVADARTTRRRGTVLKTLEHGAL